MVDPPMISGDGRELRDRFLPFISVFVRTRLRQWFSSFVDTHLADNTHFTEGM